MFKKEFLIYIFSFLGGILLHSIFLNASIDNILLLFILGISIFLFFFSKGFIKIIAISTLFFLLGFLRFDLSINNNQKHVLDYFSDKKIEVVLSGKIIEKPLNIDSSQTLIINTDKIYFGQNIKDLKTKISLKTSDFNEYRYGQTIRFKTIPQKPKQFESDNGRVFDYEHFLEKDGIYYTGKSGDIKIIVEANRSIFSLLYDLKDKLLSKIYSYIPRPESSLLAGVLLGEKTALGDNLENDFRTTGLMHIVVLSGYNVSIVIIAIMIILGFLPLYTRSFIAVVGIVVFALLVGAGPTVIRASIMALFIVLAKVVGRPYVVERALLFAGIFMVFYNPWVLYFDISFQFSFLATYGLIVIMPILENKLKFIPKIFALRDSASASIAAQIMVVPLILFYIGDFSIISVFVNMLVLFMVPITMGLGFLTAIIGFLSPAIASIVAVPTTFSLKYILILVGFFAKVPFAKINVPKFSSLLVIIYYIILFFLIYRNRKTKHNLVNLTKGE